MAYPDAETITAAFLVAQGHGTLGTDIFRGPVIEPGLNMPIKALFVVAHDGPPAQRRMGTARKSWKRPTVEIFVRSEPEDRDAGRNLALAVLSSLDKVDIPNTVGQFISESAPRYIERDRLNNHLWLVKIELWFVD